MTEYIERKSVLTILDDYCVIDEAYNAVKALPAANVVEARHAHWMRKHIGNGWDDLDALLPQLRRSHDRRGRGDGDGEIGGAER